MNPSGGRGSQAVCPEAASAILPTATAQEARKSQLRRQMERTRGKTLRLLDQIPDELLKIRVHDFYSPIGWHFGHIAMTEEAWTLVQALRRPARDAHYAFLFANIPDNPKDNRVYLPDRQQIVRYLAETRERVLTALQETDLDTDAPLLADGYAWDFADQHECQHQETIAELLQLLCKHTAAPEISQSEAATVLAPATETPLIPLPGGTFLMGADDRHGYDNEKRAHEVTVEPFLLDVTPVTAAQWVQFVQEGGYERPELWTAEGLAWREREQATLPEYWFRCGDGYGYYGQAGPRGIHPDEPVSSISWHEANAYARWCGKRLPTEAEWEFAAAFDPATAQTRRYPWGDDPAAPDEVDCDLQGVRPQPISPHCAGNPFGLRDMAGKVWEWTSTPFLPYPGFAAFPYDGYSKDHMDGRHYVCRGGSRATAPRILRCSFRNWYIPTYRQGFLGLRLASDN